MTTAEHWNAAYGAKSVGALSWYQTRPAISLELVANAGIAKSDAVIDVGGGASTLVDHLLELGFDNVTVLDLAGAALRAAQERLGDRASSVRWQEANVLLRDPGGPYALWHDRAVFHFLTDPEDRHRYAEVLQRAVRPGGTVVIATFAPDGPERCSGLPVQRWDSEALDAELGDAFTLVDSRRESHQTPAGKEQRFCYSVFRSG